MLVSEQELKAACHAASTSWTLSGDQVYRLYKEVESNLSPSPRAQALEEKPVAYLRQKDIDRLASCHRGAINVQIANTPFLGFLTPVFTSLSSQPVADGWLPIETCPPEHVLFFGVDRHGDKVTAEGFKAVNGRLSVGNADLKPFTFTHWRPLPASPGASECPTCNGTGSEGKGLICRDCEETRPTGGSDHGE